MVDLLTKSLLKASKIFNMLYSFTTWAFCSVAQLSLEYFSRAFSLCLTSSLPPSESSLTRLWTPSPIAPVRVILLHSFDQRVTELVAFSRSILKEIMAWSCSFYSISNEKIFQILQLKFGFFCIPYNILSYLGDKSHTPAVGANFICSAGFLNFFTSTSPIMHQNIITFIKLSDFLTKLLNGEIPREARVCRHSG